MKKIFRQPLVHFLLVGAGFFILYNMVADSTEDDRVIVVDQESLMTYMQYQAKGFNREVFEDRLGKMSREDLQQMIDRYVRGEVLYREAKAMGLDKEDDMIKRRMIQKVEFISQGIAESTAEITDAALSQYYEENKENYYIEPLITFTHVFFSSERWGLEGAGELASKELNELNSKAVSFDMGPGRGDRFYYHRNYVERDPKYVASHFGESMARSVFALEPSDRTWHGPYQSEYGHHLVMVIKIIPGRFPEIEEVKGRLTEDLQRVLVRQQNDETIRGIIDQYEVIVTVDRN